MKGVSVALASPLTIPSETAGTGGITEGYATAFDEPAHRRRMRSGRYICRQPAQRGCAVAAARYLR